MGLREDLIGMGFAVDRVARAVASCDDMDAALHLLTSEEPEEQAQGGASAAEAQLKAMGFAHDQVQAALLACDNDQEAATQWLLDQPAAAPAPAVAPAADARGVEAELMSMGFERSRVLRAIRERGQDLEAALQWLVETVDDEAGAGAPPAAKAQRREPAAAAPAPSLPAARAAAAAPAPPARARPAAAPVAAPAAASSASSSTAPRAVPVARDGNQRSLKRLMKELSTINAMDERGGSRKQAGFEAGPLDESDLYVWELRLYDFESDQPISADLRSRKLDAVTLRVHFPPDYPNAPPFVHMLRPRLREGTGYVLGGGGICMELLTPSEWSPATGINSLVQSVRSMLMTGGARLRDTKPSTREPDYSVQEARRDFAHIVNVHKKHGWTSHPMFKDS